MSSVKKIIKVGRKVKQVGVEDNKKDTKCCSKCKKDLKYNEFTKDNENDKMIITMGVLMAGYLASRITNGKDNKETFRIHRLVASEFLTNPENLPFVNHKDGCKTNNKLDNLEYISPSDNVKHAYDTGLYKKGGKIAIYQLDNYFKIIKEYDSISTAKKELKFGNSLSDILQGQGKSCKGFFWCYKKTYNIELDKFNKNYMVKVNQLNKKAKKIIKKWDNIIDAAKSFSDNIIIIYNILESIKTQKLSNGFRWQYAE